MSSEKALRFYWDLEQLMPEKKEAKGTLNNDDHFKVVTRRRPF